MDFFEDTLYDEIEATYYNKGLKKKKSLQFNDSSSNRNSQQSFRLSLKESKLVELNDNSITDIGEFEKPQKRPKFDVMI